MTIFTQTLKAEDLLRGDLKLASPPTVYLALTKVIEDPNKSNRDAAAVIESDAGLAMRLLKIVNSAYFGFPAKVSSLPLAVSLIGVRELQNLVLATLVIERFSELPGQQFSIHDFWARNLRCALAARHLDVLSGKKYADTAFLCGLVHNIGQLVMYRRIPVLAREVDLLLRAQTSPDIDEAMIETQIIGFDRYQVGAALSTMWKLPPIVTDSIRLHRFPDFTGQHAQIATLVRLANQLSKADMPGLSAAIDGVDLSVEQISVVLDRVHEEFATLFDLFYPPA
ncbi:HDOD domain-containing protein [Methylomonas sp. HYX-M1]|uniref:HDOD domain-containing protein n=1 Tax=Methylomonas sp. HYX-M1 TaxID=3139307 RepID=UPI00345BD368